MTKKIALITIVAVMLAGVAAFAADNMGFGAGKTRNITFNTTVKVGEKALAPGEYNVTHLMEGDQHTLVFKTLTNKEEVRVKCNMTQLPKKADDTMVEMKKIGNEQVLTGLVFRGDTYRHSL